MKNILIIGCGLLGSSLLRRIHKKKIANKIFIYEKSSSNVSKIKKLKLPGIIIKDLDLAVKNSDLIILCTPMSEYKNLIVKMNKSLSDKNIITDIGSSKIESSKIIKKFLKKGIVWTQGHPIAGSEVSGPENGKQDIFENKWCVLIKEKNTKKKHLNLLSSFWKKMGSKIVIMSAEKHDKIFSMTSHLPHLIAYNLVKSAQDFEKIQNYDLIKYSAGGLRDFTRIAASDPLMWKDIFIDNSDNILKVLDNYSKNLEEIKNAIKNKDSKKLLEIFSSTKKVRKEIIEAGQDTDKPGFGRN